MRAVVLVLVGLAGLKVWTQDHIYRSATEEALVHAYRDRAIEACAKGRREPRAGVGSAWSHPSAIRLVIGKRDLDVAIWDVENALWAVRYKYPILVLDAGAQSPGLTCEYDVTLGTAAVHKPRT